MLDASGIWVGRCWCDDEDDYKTLIRDLLDGRYSDPARIVCFNTTEGWSRVVTMDIAGELQRRWAEGEAMPASLQHLLEMTISPQKR
ncbi:hypothetical protein [Bradyrhizobium iriomotense]|uniref:hypothetical protein n=1 Tax=Bradyrhizobium iriomotense TaxID=441950 RepID=UPI0024E0DE16|nr:hypothetical protein [Bradyrhizobium iriomotense]